MRKPEKENRVTNRDISPLRGGTKYLPTDLNHIFLDHAEVVTPSKYGFKVGLYPFP